jgi:hypothetical protein
MLGTGRDLRRFFNSHTESLATAVKEFLEAEGLKYRQHKEDLFEVPVGTDEGAWKVWIAANEGASILLVLSSLPVRVPAKKRLEAAALLNRFNWKFNVGCFEMDTADGEIRFRTSVDVEHAREAALPLMKQLFRLNVATVARHYKALTAFATNPRMTVEEAEQLVDH